jgi:hypothetical protein
MLYHCVKYYSHCVDLKGSWLQHHQNTILSGKPYSMLPPGMPDWLHISLLQMLTAHT